LTFKLLFETIHMMICQPQLVVLNQDLHAPTCALAVTSNSLRQRDFSLSKTHFHFAHLAMVASISSSFCYALNCPSCAAGGTYPCRPRVDPHRPVRLNHSGPYSMVFESLNA